MLKSDVVNADLILIERKWFSFCWSEFLKFCMSSPTIVQDVLMNPALSCCSSSCYIIISQGNLFDSKQFIYCIRQQQVKYSSTVRMESGYHLHSITLAWILKFSVYGYIE